jgi:lipoyl(octanoyl) transferase
MTGLDVRILPRMDYAEALALQESLVEERRRGAAGDTLLLLEHDPVFTLGRGTKDASRPRGGTIPVLEVGRGGDVTYHGPGQLVGYWIRKLEGTDRDLHRHLRSIEDVLIDALARLHLQGCRESGKTGVWVGDKKVASIGVAVRHWITYHGFALNLDVDARIYERFRPCGLEPRVMSDLRTLAERAVGLAEAAAAVAAAFGAWESRRAAAP